MKRRGKNRPLKRRSNRLHRSRLEALEDRRMLAVTFDTFQAGDSDHNGSTGGSSPNLYVDKEAMLTHWSKFNTSLASVAVQYETQIEQGRDESNLTFETTVQLYDNKVLVDLVASQEAATLAADLQGLGATRIAAYGRVVSAWIPVSSLSSLAELESAQFASGVVKPQTSVGLVDNQADIALRTNEVRAALGIDGTGITIGILSDSFDALGLFNRPNDYAADVASGDLPPNITVLSDYPFGSDEGRAMAQLIHDIAPGATLIFYSAFNGMADYANGIIALAQAGADIIVDDVMYTNEPMFQDGIVAQAVDTVVNAGVAYFSAAGNMGRDSYQSIFRDATLTEIPDDDDDDDDDDNVWIGAAHDFDSGSGVDTQLSVTIPPGSTFQAVLQWTEPTASAGGVGSASDYDFWLLNDAGVVVDFSIGINGGNDPYEMLQYTNRTGNSQFHIVVTRFSGPDADLIKFVGFGWENQGITLNEFHTQSSTSYGHSNAAGAAGVGAAYYVNTPAFGQSPAQAQSYSSAGNTLIYFDADGTKKPIFESRRSLRFVAPDGTNTTFFGVDAPEDPDLYPNFFGTSAAAPHAAAVAALILQVNPNLSPWQVYEIMENTAIDMDRSGYDFNTGYGLIDAVAALGATPRWGGDGGGPVTPPTDACGIPLPEGTVSFAGAIGGNFFASNHAILDGTEQGGLGYDEVVLNFLRGDGTPNEIPKSQYSIAVIGNSTVDWGFSNGTQIASGYERTTFYDINFITPQDFQELIQHDALIILSGENAVAGGLSANEMALWATIEAEIATAVNDRGLDLWVGASGGSAAYYDFLPTGALEVEDVAGLDPLSGYLPTIEGQLLGLTVDMTNSSAADYYFVGFDGNLFPIEYRYPTEYLSVIGSNIAFYQDTIVAAEDVPGGTTVGLTGFVYNDFDGDGFHDPLEPGVGGASFFIDYNGDGLLGLCEPTATSNAAGQFRLRSAYSGTFQILPVPSAGAASTTSQPVWVTIEADGSATLSAPLEFGVISGNDTGAPGTGGSVPVAAGAYLGASPIADDGVIFTHGLKKGTNTVTIVSSVDRTNVVLNAWMDFNKDGDWDDLGERIFTNLRLQPGQNTYTFTIPSNVFDDSMLPDAARLPVDVRFRVGPTLGIGPEANDAFGEIEDYQVFISQAPDNGLRAVDDVFEYVEDTDGQVFNVLANDSSFFDRTLRIVPGSINVISPVTVPPLDIRVSADGRRVIFDADGVTGLAQDITFEYTVQDSAGVTATATVTLVAAVEEENLGAGAAQVMTFNNSAGQRADVNGDGQLTGRDLALVLSELRNLGARDLPKLGQAPKGFNLYIDVNGDGRFNSRDLAALLDDLLWASLQPGEPIEQEPLSTQSLASASDSPVGDLIRLESVEVAAPLSNNRSGEVVAETLPLVVGVQPLASDLAVANRSSQPTGSWAAAPVVHAEEALIDATLASLGSGQDDLLWVEGDSLADLGREASEEDDLFADDQWEDELLSL